MGRATKFVYGVGLYQIGTQIYHSARSYYNAHLDETPIKDRLAIFRDPASGDGKEWALITGSSDGIGRVYALELARNGYNVKLAARNAEKLAKVAEEAKALNP